MSPLSVKGPIALGHSLLLSPIHKQGAGWEGKQPGHKLVPILDAAFGGEGLAI